MSGTPMEPWIEPRISALAAGELDDAEAARVREEMSRSPRRARLYGELRSVHRALQDFRGGANQERPELRKRILSVTLPPFRALYGRRGRYWPTWLAAAAAAVLVLFLEPPPLRSALDSLAAASTGVSELRAAAIRQTDRALVELAVLRASLGIALEDRMDRLGDRLRDLERATRRRDDRARDPAAGGFEGTIPADPGGDTAP